jgi:repressor LexA
MTEDVLIELTERQEQVLDYIDSCINAGLPPTREEIAEHCGIWTSSADDILRALVKKERITIIPGIARGIKLVAP